MEKVLAELLERLVVIAQAHGEVEDTEVQERLDDAVHRGFLLRTDTELLRRFPRNRLAENEYPCVAFELAHPDPAQKPVLLGYEDTRGYDTFFSPYAVRWEPSGEQREMFDAE